MNFSALPRLIRKLALVSLVAVFAAAGVRQAPALQPSHAPDRPLVFVPGLLGSKLCRAEADGKVTLLWGTLETILRFPDLAMGGPSPNVKPCGLIEEVTFLGVYTQDIYRPFVERLEKAGYRQGSTLLIFDYDWRLSVFVNAQRLAAFIDEKVPGNGSVDIVAHSMGGLIAHAYALEEGGSARIDRLITAATPWRGSVHVFQLLEDGWGAGNLITGGLESVRRTILSFPATYELLPSYEGCCSRHSGSGKGFQAGNPAAWEALNWEGVDRKALPDLATAQARQERLRQIVDTPMPETVEEVLIIGMDQRTPESYELHTRRGHAHFSIHTSWEGDGIVTRDSAQLERRVAYPTTFAAHSAILNDTLVQDFLINTLSQGSAAAMETVPVRERPSIRTAVGTVVELVGVEVVTDQPVYSTNASATATVHLRLSVQSPVDASRFKLTVARPDEAARPVTLSPATQASDPANLFEQSFSTRFETGPVPGKFVLTLTVKDSNGKARTITRSVPVLRP